MQKSSLFAAVIGGLVALFVITHTPIISQIVAGKPSSGRVYAAGDTFGDEKNQSLYWRGSIGQRFQNLKTKRRHLGD